MEKAFDELIAQVNMEGDLSEDALEDVSAGCFLGTLKDFFMHTGSSGLHSGGKGHKF